MRKNLLLLGRKSNRSCISSWFYVKKPGMYIEETEHSGLWLHNCSSAHRSCSPLTCACSVIAQLTAEHENKWFVGIFPTQLQAAMGTIA